MQSKFFLLTINKKQHKYITPIATPRGSSKSIKNTEIKPINA